MGDEKVYHDASADLGVSTDISDPRSIDEALKKKEYFHAYALAVTWIEYFSKKILQVEIKGVVDFDVYQRAGVSQVVSALKLMGIICDNLYSPIKGIIRTRNKLIHMHIITEKKNEYKQKYVAYTLNCLHER